MREEAPLAIRTTRPYTVGYVGGCDCIRGSDRMSLSSATRALLALAVTPASGVRDAGLVFDDHNASFRDQDLVFRA